MKLMHRCRIPAGGTSKVEFFVTPLDIGSGVALPATVTYKRQEGASQTQVRPMPAWRVFVRRPWLLLCSHGNGMHCSACEACF